MVNKLDMILKLNKAQKDITYLRKGTGQKTDLFVAYDQMYNYVDCLLTSLMKDVTNMDVGGKDGPMLFGPEEVSNAGFKSPAQLDRERLAMMFEYMYKTDTTFKLYVDSR